MSISVLKTGNYDVLTPYILLIYGSKDMSRYSNKAVNYYINTEYGGYYCVIMIWLQADNSCLNFTDVFLHSDNTSQQSGS